MSRPAAVVLPLLASMVSAQTPQWQQLPAVNPLPLSGSEITYDHLRDRVIVFGGMAGHLPSAYLAEFDGASWSAPSYGSSTFPPGRAGHKIVFDGRRGETLLVGGGVFGPVFYNETWIWDGSVWTQRFPQQPAPIVYGGFTLTYDEGREVVVLYAGQSLWEWNGADWAQRTAPAFPPWRNYHAAAYDCRHDRLLVHGGFLQNSTTLSHLDTWAWDGAVWQQVATSGPGTSHPQMVFDRERGVAVLVSTGGACYEFDGTTWSLAPTGSGFGMLTWDRQRNRAVFVIPWTGQSTPVPGSTHVYEVPDLAVAQPYGTGCGSPALVAREDPNARPVIGSTLGVDLENVPNGTAFMCFGWSADQVLGLLLPRPMDVWGLPGCWLLQSDDAITLPCPPTGPSTARFSFALPPSPSFVGVPFYLQPWAPAPGLNPAGAAIGNGIAVTIGSF